MYGFVILIFIAFILLMALEYHSNEEDEIREAAIARIMKTLDCDRQTAIKVLENLNHKK